MILPPPSIIVKSVSLVISSMPTLDAEREHRQTNTDAENIERSATETFRVNISAAKTVMRINSGLGFDVRLMRRGDDATRRRGD